MRGKFSIRRLVLGALLSVSVLVGMDIAILQQVSAAGAWSISNATGSTALTGTNFNSVTMSSDGRYMYATAHAIGIFISTDYGKTWAPTPNFTSQDYWTISTSNSGQHVYAASHFGDVWYSSDYGINWTKRTVAPQTGYSWATLEVSGNGQTVIIGTETQGLFVSNDFGVTITQTSLPTTNNWYGVTISDDGLFMTAFEYGGTHHISTNGGTTWTAGTLPSGGYFESAGSKTGQYLAAIAPNDGIYTSSDYGNTWTKQPSAPAVVWYDIEMSANGKYLIAAETLGDIWTSTDYGVTWVNETTGTGLTGEEFQYVDMSDNGAYVITSVRNEDLYVGYNAVLGASTVTPASAAPTPKAPKTGFGVNMVPRIHMIQISSVIVIITGLTVVLISRTFFRNKTQRF
jgi:photosystem II stability/assembly factor-like uncharacterized protein